MRSGPQPSSQCLGSSAWRSLCRHATNVASKAPEVSCCARHRGLTNALRHAKKTSSLARRTVREQCSVASGTQRYRRVRSQVVEHSGDYSCGTFVAARNSPYYRVAASIVADPVLSPQRMPLVDGAGMLD
jgi:hypothetical protein